MSSSGNSTDLGLFQGSDSSAVDPEIISGVTEQLFQGSDGNLELISLISQMISLVISMDLISKPEPASELKLLITQTISVFNSMDLDSPSKPLQELISRLNDYSKVSNSCWRLQFQLRPLFQKIFTFDLLKLELLDSIDSESELLSHITQLLCGDKDSFTFLELVSIIIHLISLVCTIDLNFQPRPESEFMSLTTQAISVFFSMDLDSQPKQVQELISLIYQEVSHPNSMYWNRGSELQWKLTKLVEEILNLEPEPELVSLIYKIFYHVVSMNSKSGKFISLCTQIQVKLEKEEFQVIPWGNYRKWDCYPKNWDYFSSTGEEATLFRCKGCNGKNHEEYKKAPVEVKHHLHQKHFLQLVAVDYNRTRKCYCCDDVLKGTFYCCLPCDFAMNMVCVEKPAALSIDHPKWHEHTLALFPRRAFLTCNLCSLADAGSPLYMCPPCDFVVHLRCINLPRVIRISRHHHRISFNSSFDHGDLSCSVCRKDIDSDYGGYSCIQEGCSYVVHSRCATQTNVWDGKELEGEPEEEIEEIEPFVKISDGIIQHFAHQHHHLRLDDNTYRDYDENKECQACIMPIYFGNFYSCMQCDFILHEECASLSRKIYHPIHPHLLTLRYGESNIVCKVCPSYGIDGFFYECDGRRCSFFQLHVQCATISEPLVHGSHTHSLFLTSKPEEEARVCSVCKGYAPETFNCIVESDYALCFKCATLPPKVRYKHDKHILTLSYGKETSTMKYWCEVCEEKIDPKGRFYMCDENCCVTLHIECLLGHDLYMKRGSSWSFFGGSTRKVQVLPNNHHLTRPICFFCEKRCTHKRAFQWFGDIFCSLICMNGLYARIYLKA
ncbi:Zinc finger PHD-type [Arabidopsis thaliana x Arabidopsis arenosa]|uniref:Zinc finger PHD-type n=1 Tax=Arabidopsis thaliana x Arabidopsis arenosa TaxID=1240361 RepID=A0A8T1Z1W1_9BRAS|nr:Zinc finger PHD-type [Arabidopsis thaliana x Arabidopsis arenosa]